MAELIELETLGFGSIEGEAGGDAASDYFTQRARNDAIDDYLAEQDFRRVGYGSSNLNDVLARYSNERNLIRHYGYEPEEFANLDPDDVPEQLQLQLENLDFGDYNQGGIDEVEERGRQITEQTESKQPVDSLRPSKSVTFQDVNAQGYRSNFRRGRNFRNLYTPRSGSAFRNDDEPPGFFARLFGREPKTEDVFYADYVGEKSSQGIGQIFAAIDNIYNT